MLQSELITFITDNLPSSYKVNPRRVRSLLNYALDQIEIREGEWSNTDAMDGMRSMTLPTACKVVTRAVYNEEELDKLTLFQMAEDYPDWKTATGDPSAFLVDGTNIILDSAPVSAPVGILKVYGYATLGHFSDDPDDINPLDYIPDGQQYAPAYYVLSQLPTDPRDPMDATRRQENFALWQQAKVDLDWAATKRRGELFGF